MLDGLIVFLVAASQVAAYTLYASTSGEDAKFNAHDELQVLCRRVLALFLHIFKQPVPNHCKSLFS